MRALLSIVLGLILVVGIAVVALPYLVPQEFVQTQLVRQIERATGREIALAGDVELRVLPRPAARLGGLSVAGSADVDGPPLVQLEGMDAELALAPLFSGEIQVDRFVLRGLRVELVIDEEGDANWLAPGAGGESGSGDGTTAAETADGGATTGVPPVSLDDVRLVDGVVRFTDRRSDTRRIFEDIDGTVTMAALDQPLELELTGRLDGRDVEVEGGVGAVEPILAGGATSVDLRAVGGGLDLGFAGNVDMGDAPELAGDVDLGIDGAADTIGWLAGQDVDVPVATLGLETAVTASPARIEMTGLSLRADDTDGTGELTLALDQPRPRLTGTLDIGEVDLAAFGMTAEADAGGSGSGGGGGGDGGGADGWSRAPIAYAQPPVDIDVGLTVAGLRAPPLRFGAGAVRLQNDAERILVTLDRLGFYEGTATGSVRVAPGADGGVAIEKDVALENVATGPLLADLAGTSFLSGRGNVSLAVTSVGASIYDLVAASDGGGRFNVGRAVVSGLEGQPALEALRALLALGGEPGAPLRLANAEASFDLTDGVVTNNDLVAATANLRITGEGAVNLVERRVPGYTVTPESTGALRQFEALQQVLVPLVIEGPFDRLSARPDPTAVPERAVEQVERALDSAAERARQGDLEGAAETIINEGLGGVLQGLGIGR